MSDILKTIEEKYNNFMKIPKNRDMLKKLSYGVLAGTALFGSTEYLRPVIMGCLAVNTIVSVYEAGGIKEFIGSVIGEKGRSWDPNAAKSFDLIERGLQPDLNVVEQTKYAFVPISFSPAPAKGIARTDLAVFAKGPDDARLKAAFFLKEKYEQNGQKIDSENLKFGVVLKDEKGRYMVPVEIKDVSRIDIPRFNKGKSFSREPISLVKPPSVLTYDKEGKTLGIVIDNKENKNINSLNHSQDVVPAMSRNSQLLERQKRIEAINSAFLDVPGNELKDNYRSFMKRETKNGVSLDDAEKKFVVQCVEVYGVEKTEKILSQHSPNCINRVPEHYVSGIIKSFELQKNKDSFENKLNRGSVSVAKTDKSKSNGSVKDNRSIEI